MGVVNDVINEVINAAKYEVLTFDNMEKYRSFDSVAEMDSVIYGYIELLRNNEHPESVIEVLRFFGRSSLRITGVSFVKYQTISDAIGKSISTVKRSIKVLKEYGMIEAIPTIKKWLGRGKSRRKSVNIIVINPEMTRQNETSVEDEEPTPDKAIQVGNESEPFNSKHSVINSINTYAKPTSPYQRFKTAVTTFIGEDSQTLISRLYGVYLAQTKDLRKAYDPSELIDVAIRAINTTFNVSKSKPVRNMSGYYNGVLSNMLDNIGIELMAEMWA